MQQLYDFATNHLAIFFFVVSVPSFCFGMLFGRLMSAVRIVVDMQDMIKEGVVPTHLLAAAIDFAIIHHNERINAGLEKELSKYQATIRMKREE